VFLALNLLYREEEKLLVSNNQRRMLQATHHIGVLNTVLWWIIKTQDQSTFLIDRENDKNRQTVRERESERRPE
jgi:hypothetical protein